MPEVGGVASTFKTMGLSGLPFAAESISLCLGSLRDGKLHVQRPFPVLN